MIEEKNEELKTKNEDLIYDNKEKLQKMKSYQSELSKLKLANVFQKKILDTATTQEAPV